MRERAGREHTRSLGAEFACYLLDTGFTTTEGLERMDAMTGTAQAPTTSPHGAGAPGCHDAGAVRARFARPDPPAGASASRRDTPTSPSQGPNVRFHLEFRKDTGNLVVEVRDHRTGETIRQFPPEALLEACHQMKDLRGLLVNERA